MITAPLPGHRTAVRIGCTFLYIVATVALFDDSNTEHRITADVEFDGTVSLWGREDGLELEGLAAILDLDSGHITDRLRETALEGSFE